MRALVLSVMLHCVSKEASMRALILPVMRHCVS